MTTHPLERGPYLSAALLCERVLQEGDGVKSAIRILDRVTKSAIGPNPPTEMAPFDYNVAFLLRFKAGDARGSRVLTIRLIKPSFERPKPLQQSVFFEGEEDRGIDIVANMTIRIEMTGIYWFEVLLDDVFVTRVPLRVVYLRQIIPTGGPSAGLPPDQGQEPPPKS